MFEFGLLTIRVVQFLDTRGPIGVAVSYQILRCGTSAGANYEEADDGSSPRDKVAKKKIALREIKESFAMQSRNDGGIGNWELGVGSSYRSSTLDQISASSSPTAR